METRYVSIDTDSRKNPGIYMVVSDNGTTASIMDYLGMAYTVDSASLYNVKPSSLHPFTTHRHIYLTEPRVAAW